MKIFPLSKHSQGETITIVMIIMIVIVAMFIVTSLVINTINNQKEQIHGEIFAITLDSPSKPISNEFMVQVKVHRGSGKANLNSIKFLLKDDKGNFYNYNSTNIPDELETKTYTIPYADIGLSSGKIIQVQFFPVLNDSNNKQIIGIPSPELKIGSESAALPTCVENARRCSSATAYQICHSNAWETPITCEDSNACNGVETCSAGACQAGTLITCNPGYICSNGVCVFDISVGLVSWWKFDGSVQDSVGINHGILGPGAIIENGYLTLNGTNTSYVNISNLNANGLSFGANNFSVSFWINPKKAGTYQYIFSNGAPMSGYGANYGYWIRLNTLNQIEFAAGTYPSNVFRIASINPIPLNQWTNVQAIKNNTGVSLYFNNNLQQISIGYNSFSNTNASSFCQKAIGYFNKPCNDGNGFGSYFNGSIDNLMIYNKTLNINEINVIYNSQK
ncbi:LamG domain-containing protein [Candidatus Pacearchaeota archaeon]|nr:hypothetical protein [uncultured archaeon]MBS3078821.1 LamG domain-containing protein [Candidatus Pacearchaeota archaeon]